MLPALIAARRVQGTLSLRLWSAGCSTGPEPYSLAILLDHLLPDRTRWELGLVATDINSASLAEARRGVYREWALREVPADLRDRYFTRRGPDRYLLDREIRDMVRFEPANLAGEPPALVARESMDLVVCRNALMYLTADAFEATVARLRWALAKGGWLVVAPVEASAERFRPLTTVNFPGAIFFKSGRPAKRSQGVPLVVEQADTARPPVPHPVAARAEPSLRTTDPCVPESAPAVADVNGLLGQAAGLADSGKLAEALTVCEEALRRDRLHPEVHRLMAAIHQERGDAAAALAFLRRALYLDPDSPELHLALGNVLLQSGDRRRGLHHLGLAAQLGRAPQ